MKPRTYYGKLKLNIFLGPGPGIIEALNNLELEAGLQGCLKARQFYFSLQPGKELDDSSGMIHLVPDKVAKKFESGRFPGRIVRELEVMLHR